MRKSIALFLSMLLLITVFCVGCNKQSEKTEPDIAMNKGTDESFKRTITDANDQVVEIPQNVRKIAITCHGGATHELVVLGAEDMIVAQPTMERFPLLMKIKPQFNGVVDAGSFDNVNVEELLKLEPDVVFAFCGSEKGNTKIKEVGIPVVTMLCGKANIQALKNEFLTTGIILDKNDEAKKLVAYWDEKLGLINNRLSRISEEQRKKVYYAGGQLLKTEGGQWWINELVTNVGGVLVSKDMVSNGVSMECSIEQLIGWDPDVIVCSRETGKSGLAEEIKKDPRLKDLTAIKNNAVYDYPLGAFWWNRPSPEAPLGFIWLAKTLYPEETRDIDLKAETKKFYKEFYKYELSDKEYESFF